MESEEVCLEALGVAVGAGEKLRHQGGAEGGSLWGFPSSPRPTPAPLGKYYPMALSLFSLTLFCSLKISFRVSLHLKQTH